MKKETRKIEAVCSWFKSLVSSILFHDRERNIGARSLIIDWLTFLNNLQGSEIFGVLDAFILMIALFGFNEVGKRLKFSSGLSLRSGLAYNFLIQSLRRKGIVLHAIILLSFMFAAIVIHLYKSGKLN